MFLQLISYIITIVAKAYFNKYQAKIAEILKNLEMEDSVAARDDSFKARFLALQLDFSKSAHRKLNTDGGDILGQVSQTNNRPGDI